MTKFRIDVNDIVGLEVGKLKVLCWSHHDGKNHHYKALCQCGRITTAERKNLRGGKTRSCSCFHAENDDELREIIMRIPPNGRGCRIWPGGTSHNGYGIVNYNGNRSSRIHVESARIFLGPRPEGLVTMHAYACKKCCEPTHLSYGTQSQNHLDAYANEGKAKRGEAMNLEKARQARRMYPRMTQRAIAKRFGCSTHLINYIVNNKSWAEPIIATPKDTWSSHNHYQQNFNF